MRKNLGPNNPVKPMKFRLTIDVMTLLDSAIISASVFIVFHELLLNGYVGYFDFSTVPSFVPLYPLLSLSGISLGPPIFSINLNPGLALAQSILVLLFGHLGINVFYFLYLLLYAFGIRLLWLLLQEIELL
ncbi:hypothetical protein [Metallosphaera javensis (ex Hofmann et al. 2022)]|uniref:hypothetical protein n=1 Tax=Metallosphaera javensis (ex Hofmann et al. 2022) TaxID=99938 RepID=UPI001EE0C885|nr:hypothetical protein [Metallosphaera javensis (ex Hofmann et al. 2022)]